MPSYESQFLLASVKLQVEKMSRQQLKELVVSLYEHLLAKDAICKEVIKVKIGYSEFPFPKGEE